MPTYPVTLTKASNNTVSHSLHLAEGQEGQPRVRLGSREREAAKAGQRGTIVIQSLHHGSGQHVARDPMMYEFADGMFSDEPGLLKTRGQVQTVYTLGTAQPFRGWERGAIASRLSDFDVDDVITITPTQVYQANTAKMAPVTNARFTGSVARLHEYLYFGQEAYGNGRHYSTWAGMLYGANGTYTNNAGFNASFVAVQAAKMWKAEKRVSGIDKLMSLSWTDDTNATPVFSTPYDRLVSAFDIPKDLAIIGPHAVIALVEAGPEGTRLMAVDTEGMFTEILSGLPSSLQFFPFLGGQLLWLMGGPRALWMSDVGSFRDVGMLPVDSNRAKASLPTFDLVAGTGTNPGVGGVVSGRELFFGLYGTFTKRDGNTVSGSAIVHGLLDPDGLHVHTIATPESVSVLENSHVMAMKMYPALVSGLANDPAKPRMLYFVTATPETNAANSTVKLNRMELWEGSVEPASFDTNIKFLRTSRYVGDSWTTKQGELLRGYITKIPDNSSAVVRVYLDGDSNETYNFSINSIGPFAQSLPANVIGRDVALDMETNANGSVIIEFPWSLDYFAVPDQKDIVRLPVLAGRDQVLPGGGLTVKTRAETLVALESICTSKERWTLSWWDATPDWDVIPLGYEAAEIEPAYVEGAGAAVAWLTLQRL